MERKKDISALEQVDKEDRILREAYKMDYEVRRSVEEELTKIHSDIIYLKNKQAKMDKHLKLYTILAIAVSVFLVMLLLPYMK